MRKTASLSIVDIVLMAVCLVIGGFPEWVSCLTTVFLAGYSLVRLCRKRVWTIQADWLTLAVATLCAGYGVTCLWAVDRGMAFIGFVKFLPLLLYLFVLQQEQRTVTLTAYMPYLAAAMTAVSTVLSLIPQTASLVTVADRLAGFFQYPNTFAVFLLVCELLLLSKPSKRWYDYATCAVLIGGLLYTGSRITFVLCILANIAMLFACVNKKKRVRLLIGMVAAIVIGGAVLWLARDSFLGRYLTISLTQSTFVGRILYVLDALPLLWQHPFGMGYRGYAYTQMGSQTGVYSVAFVHNDLMQILLDVGWIPAVCCIICAAAFFCRRDVPLTQKIPVAALCAHALLDFDLQYIVMDFLLIAMLYRPSERRLTLPSVGRTLLGTFLVVVGVVSAYMSVPLVLAHSGLRDASHTMYAYNTQNILAMLETEDDLDEAHMAAEHLLEYNTSYYVPYSIEAKYAYSQGNIRQVIENKRAAIERAPFQYSEYEEYAAMLINAVVSYEAKGDAASATVCKRELVWLETRLSQTAKRLSPLGAMIDDQPTTAFSADVQAYVEKWRDAV